MKIVLQTIMQVALSFGFALAVHGQTALLKNFNPKDVGEGRGTYLSQIGCGKDDLLCGIPSILAPNVLILGDSHATDAFNALYSAWPEVNFLLSRSHGCAPYPETESRDAKCGADNLARWEKIDTVKNVAAVVIKIRLIESRANDLVTFIKDISKKYPKVIVFGAGPLYERDLFEVYERFNGERLGEFRDESPYNADESVRAAVESVGGVFIDQRAFFCPDGVCTDITRDGSTLVVADKHHQTLQTSKELGIFLRQQMPDLFAKN
jgi:hypothetical protein